MLKNINFTQDNIMGGDAFEKENFGSSKTAILLITLGSEVASEIMKFLNEDEINKISFEIATINSVTIEERKDILHEFIEMNKAKEFYLKVDLIMLRIF